jgi:hypothetical protein
MVYHEEFEATKWAIESRISKRYRQYNDQTEKGQTMRSTKHYIEY